MEYYYYRELEKCRVEFGNKKQQEIKVAMYERSGSKNY